MDRTRCIDSYPVVLVVVCVGGSIVGSRVSGFVVGSTSFITRLWIHDVVGWHSFLSCCTGKVRLIGCLTSQSTIFQSYMTAHRCAGGLKKKLDLRSGSQRHRHFVGWLVVLRINVDLAIFQPYLDLEAGYNQSLKVQVARTGIEPPSSCSASQGLNHSATAAPHRHFVGFFNVPVQAPTRGHPFYTVIPTNVALVVVCVGGSVLGSRVSAPVVGFTSFQSRLWIHVVVGVPAVAVSYSDMSGVTSLPVYWLLITWESCADTAAQCSFIEASAAVEHSNSALVNAM